MTIAPQDTTEVERPRRRRLISIVAVLVPVLVLAGAAAWFVRAYVMPPTVSFTEPMTASPTNAAPAPVEPSRLSAALPTLPSPAAPAPVPEITGTASGFSAPNWTPSLTSRTSPPSIWDSVPLPGPPRQAQQLATEPPAAASEPNAGSVPLPRQPPRPPLSADAGNRVPLPKPRPAIAN